MFKKAPGTNGQAGEAAANGHEDIKQEQGADAAEGSGSRIPSRGATSDAADSVGATEFERASQSSGQFRWRRLAV